VISPRDIPECFEGIIPAMMTTCSLEGEPNITEISQVHLVDDTHVALSHQFFNKTQRNVRENPHASVLLFSPRTYEQYRLQLRFDHPESEGPLFDEMAARLQVIASHTGMVGVFKLRCADVYEVLSAEHVEGYLLPADPRVPRQERTEGRLEAMARELRGLQAPLFAQRGGDIADDGGVKTVQQDDQETQGKDQDLIGRDFRVVDDLADTSGVLAHGGSTLIRLVWSWLEGCAGVRLLLKRA